MLGLRLEHVTLILGFYDWRTSINHNNSLPFATIIVWPINEGFEIVEGHRRFLACKYLQ